MALLKNATVKEILSLPFAGLVSSCHFYPQFIHLQRYASLSWIWVFLYNVLFCRQWSVSLTDHLYPTYSRRWSQSEEFLSAQPQSVLGTSNFFSHFREIYSTTRKHQWRIRQTFTALLAKEDNTKCQDWTMMQDWNFSDSRSLTPDSISHSFRDSLSLVSCVVWFLILSASHRNVDLMISLLISSQPSTWIRTIIQWVLWEIYFSDKLPTDSQENFPHVYLELTKSHLNAVWCCFTIFPKEKSLAPLSL